MRLKGVMDYPANLRCPGFATDITHLIEQCTGLCEPMTGSEFTQAPVITKLYRQRLFIQGSRE